MENINKNFLVHACELARTIGANAILINIDTLYDSAILKEINRKYKNLTIYAATKHDVVDKGLKESEFRIIKVPVDRMTRMGQIKIAVLIGLSTGVLKENEKLICITGIAETGLLDTISFIDVSKEFEVFSAFDIKEIHKIIKSNIFQRVLDIAISLSREGREGKPVGTMFVIGEYEEIKPYLQQMIMNPFKGYKKNMRNILDDRLIETIKEFSTIDGAFIIDKSGIVQSAGTYLKSTGTVESLPRGLGARHYSAAGITGVSSAIAITVSESTGSVTVFHNGKILTEIESPRKIGKKSKERDEFYEKPAGAGTV